MAVLQLKARKQFPWPCSRPPAHGLRVVSSQRTVDKFNVLLNEQKSEEREREESSRFLTLEEELLQEFAALDAIPKLADALNYAPDAVPTSEVIAEAKILVRALRMHRLRAERVIPSADGGIAAMFVSENSQRAYIEILNDGEISAVFYSTAGYDHSERLETVRDPRVLARMIAKIRVHLEGRTVATAAL